MSISFILVDVNKFLKYVPMVEILRKIAWRRAVKDVPSTLAEGSLFKYGELGIYI